MIFNTGNKNTQWGKDSLFNKCHWENSISMRKIMKLNFYLKPYKKKKNLEKEVLNVEKSLKLLDISPKELKS